VDDTLATLESKQPTAWRRLEFYTERSYRNVRSQWRTGRNQYAVAAVQTQRTRNFGRDTIAKVMTISSIWMRFNRQSYDKFDDEVCRQVGRDTSTAKVTQVKRKSLVSTRFCSIDGNFGILAHS